MAIRPFLFARRICRLGAASPLVDGTDGSLHFPFTDVFVPCGFLGSVRAAFDARTGGAADLVDIDNLNVAFIPEPSSIILAVVAAVAGLGVAYRRRRSL